MKKLICILLAIMMLAAITACAEEAAKPQPDATVSGGEVNPEDVFANEPQYDNGERYSSTIIIEGEEQPIECMHFISDLGYAMDYYCDEFIFTTGEGSDCYQWYLDDMEQFPQNMMSISTTVEDAQTVADNLESELKGQFDEVLRMPGMVGGVDGIAFYCSELIDDSYYTAGTLIDCFVVPAADGCRIVELQYTAESAEGIGARFYGMLDSFYPTVG